MYLDAYVLSGIVIVVLACIMMGYVGWYAYRAIQRDQAAANKQDQRNRA